MFLQWLVVAFLDPSISDTVLSADFSDSIWEVSTIPQLLLGGKKFYIFLERKN